MSQKKKKKKKLNMSHKKKKKKGAGDTQHFFFLLEKLLTSFEGTQRRVPVLSTPASTVTPRTMGSLLLKIACKHKRTVIFN